MANQWFKFYGGEYLSDPKIERLSPIERSCWITLLSVASMGEDGIVEFLTIESLLNKSGIQLDPYHPEDWEKALGVLTKFKNLRMIDFDEYGKITVINWAKRQEHNLTVAERVAKSRAKKRSVTINVTNVTTDKNRIEENRDKELPLWLNKKAWEAWLQHRKEKKKPLTPTSLKLQLKFLEENKIDHTKIIKNSIVNGWTGLFPIDSAGKNGSYSKRVEYESESRERKKNEVDNERMRKLTDQSKELALKFKTNA